VPYNITLYGPKSYSVYISYSIFYIPTGNIERYTARLVAKGFTQREETFARHATMRALLANAAVEDLEVQQIDVKTAFLNGPLKKTIYIEPPAGYDFGNKVLLLKKALYGLKQAARAWNEELKRQLLTEDIIISGADASLFYLEREGRRCFLLIYVDDRLLVDRLSKNVHLKAIHKTITDLELACIFRDEIFR
jgi:hypothetical protein